MHVLVNQNFSVFHFYANIGKDSFPASFFLEVTYSLYENTSDFWKLLQIHVKCS